MDKLNTLKTNCPIARVMDILGEGWTLLVLREAFLGTRQFKDFERELGIARNILSTRLKKLVDEGLLQRVPSATDGRVVEYRLAEKGRALFPAMLALGQWAMAWACDGPDPLRIVERGSGQDIPPIEVRNRAGAPLRVRDVAMLPGPGANEALRRRYERALGGGVMNVIVRTPRLSIKPFVLDDAAFILRLLNEPSFIEHIADKGVRDLETAKTYLRDGPMASYARHGFGLWRVALLADDTPIGMAGLMKRDYLDDVDLGYALLPEFCGAGYALEAATAVMAHARERLQARRVLAIVSEDNAPSIRLLARLGFRPGEMVRIPGSDVSVRSYSCDC